MRRFQEWVDTGTYALAYLLISSGTKNIERADPHAPSEDEGLLQKGEVCRKARPLSGFFGHPCLVRAPQ